MAARFCNVILYFSQLTSFYELRKSSSPTLDMYLPLSKLESNTSGVYRRYSVNQFIIQHSRLRQSLIGQLGLGFLGLKTRLVIKCTQTVPVIDRVISTTGYSPQIPSEG